MTDYGDYDSWVATVRYDCDNVPSELEYDVFCLLAETGEIADVIKKLLRDGMSYEELREKLLLECGDALHYLSRILADIHSNLAEAAQANIEKLINREQYGKGKRGSRS